MLVIAAVVQIDSNDDDDDEVGILPRVCHFFSNIEVIAYVNSLLFTPWRSPQS